jgi:hypothetical protein
MQEQTQTQSTKAKLYQALAKAQGSIKDAKKSADNPFFKSKFADLAECLSVIQEPASKNGLSVYFNFKTEFVQEHPACFIQYILAHESGETITSDWVLMFMKDKSQHGFGAACTYYKRQLLKAIYQIPEVDDDGNSQSLTESVNNQPQVRPAQAPQKPVNFAQNIKPQVRS